MPASPAWWLRLVRLGGCYLLGLIAVGLLLVALLMTGQFRVVALWQASGLPLALLLERLPGEFWQALLGLPLPSQPVALRSLLQFLLAYAQLACLPAGLCYWLWYRR
jgi:hypothetical protein